MREREQVWAVSMVRDEADMICATVRQLVDEGVDGIIIANNRSTDSTGFLLEALQQTVPIPLIVEEDDEPGYYQARKMTRLAKLAHDRGADWIVPFDADEIWYCEGDRVAVELRNMPRGVEAVGVPMLNHYRTALDVGGTRGRLAPVTSMVFRDVHLNPLPKCAYRWRSGSKLEMGNHGVYFSGRPAFLNGSPLRIRHFPYRSAEQMIRKARNGAEAYNASDLSPGFGTHWRQYAALIEQYGEEAFTRDVWERYFYKKVPIEQGMVYDPAPYLRWQAATNAV